jgi:hypothetical protein
MNTAGMLPMIVPAGPAALTVQLIDPVFVHWPPTAPVIVQVAPLWVVQGPAPVSGGTFTFVGTVAGVGLGVTVRVGVGVDVGVGVRVAVGVGVGVPDRKPSATCAHTSNAPADETQATLANRSVVPGVTVETTWAVMVNDDVMGLTGQSRTVALEETPGGKVTDGWPAAGAGTQATEDARNVRFGLRKSRTKLGPVRPATVIVNTTVVPAATFTLVVFDGWGTPPAVVMTLLIVVAAWESTLNAKWLVGPSPVTRASEESICSGARCASSATRRTLAWTPDAPPLTGGASTARARLDRRAKVAATASA